MTELSRRSMIAALSLAGVAAFAPAVRAAEKSKENLPAGAETFDVVVAGGGAAGCMAARTACTLAAMSGAPTSSETRAQQRAP